MYNNKTDLMKLYMYLRYIYESSLLYTTILEGIKVL